MNKIDLVGWRKLSCYILILCYLSIPISAPIDLGTFQVNLPIEPLLGISAVLLFFTIEIKKLISSSFFRHPLTLFAIVYHLFMILSISYSTDYIVSAKYALINSLHFWVFYFGIYFLSINQIDVKKVLFGYILAFSAIIIYSLIKLVLYNFSAGIAPELARPFYSDHTLFGASLALLIPFLIIYRFEFIKFKSPLVILILLFTLAIIITHSQAVWLSVGIGLIAYFTIKKYALKTPFFISSGFVFVLLTSVILYKVQQIKTQSSEIPLNTSTSENSLLVKLSRDVSTLERINRYSCAIRMWNDRPFLGFGAGTFQFAYLPYQLPSEMTRLSVSTTQAADGKPHSSGKGGGAHSEYFQALVELGIIGGILWILIGIGSIHFSLKLYYSKMSPDSFSLSIFIALLGYFVHALFNNFLHDEEISFLLWSMIGLIAYYDSRSID